MRALRPGDPGKVGSFEVTHFIGEGGQGGVYLGVGAGGERVAIKMLHARFADDWQAVRRFEREAEAARRVAEFCTARVLEVGALDGRPYIVSEYVEGPSLQQQVSAQGPITGSALIRLAVTTATALAAIHRAGVMHRDFKPSNVLLGSDGARVIDFGIARALDLSQSLTTSVVGTPAYMAPEQFHGNPLPASDVFAWAGTMVYAATGRAAFGVGTLPAVMHRILALEPDLSGVPESLLPVLRSALAKDPFARPTAEQLLQALITAPPPMAAPGQDAGRAASRPAPPPTASTRQAPAATTARGPLSRVRRRAILTSAGAVATALVVGVMAWLWPRQPDPPLTQPTGGTPSVQPTGRNAALTTVLNPSGKKGGVVRLATSLTPDSTDPGSMYSNEMRSLVRLYGRALTMYRPAPGEAGMQLVPDLATKLGETTDGGRTWTYRLREGVRFDDGSPITAKDVRHAILRSAGAVLPYGSAHFDRLLRRPASSAIETPDDHTIVFHLNRQFATFDQVAALPETIPVPEGTDAGADYRTRVVSSGPYKFAGASDTALTLVRNPYWNPDLDPNRTALPDRFEVSFSRDQREIDAQLASGAVDVSPAVSPDVSPQLAPRTDVAVTTALHYLAINPQVRPFTNQKCRQAVVDVLDRVRARDAFGSGEVATTLLSPVITSRQPQGLDRRGDVDAAKKDLADCGQGVGFATGYIYWDMPGEEALAKAVQATLAKVGITVTLEKRSIADFYRKYGGSPTYLKEKGIGLISRVWEPDRPDAWSSLSALVDSRQITEKGSSINVSVRLPAIDKVVDQATRELDPARRAADWDLVESEALKAGLLVPLFWDTRPLLRGKDVTNLHVSPVYGGYELLTMGVNRP
ncbi:ABC transporter substrate-binding protein [Nonomuraea sp. NPDC005983]|uniref:ABC transporter substrate-binding protein n=1 Tax=Nonomuraea sp. NPDC005983 TaxID=3155595 RepID=UPI0033BB67EF